MPKSETSNSIDGPSFAAPRHRPHWWTALGCLVVGTLILVALLSYSPLQTSYHTTNPTEKNLVGWMGASFSAASFYVIGIATWLIPVFLFWMVVVAVRNARRLPGTRLAAMVFSILALAGISAMFESFQSSDYLPQGPGGWMGHLVYQGALRDLLGVFGTGLLLGCVYVFGLMFIFMKDIGAEFEKHLLAFHAWRAARAKTRAELRAARAEEKAARAKAKGDRDKPATATSVLPAVVEKAPAPGPVGPAGRKLVIPKNEEPLAKPATRPPMPEPEPSPAAKAPPLKLARSVATGDPASDAKALAAATGKFELNIVKAEESKKSKTATLAPRSDDKDYQFPPLTLLKEQVKAAAGNSEEEHRQNAENLLRILSEFGVEVTLGEIHVGPVITRYEVVPAAGVRVEKISGLDKNIALGMRAQSVRILAPIPGKAAVGVEVPNQHPTPVGMREILESEDWSGARAELPIALGKDVSGKPLISDLTKMPHLLIAGATGSGKSVCINSIVASILYSASPKNVRLLMVDPKVVELKVFNPLPHMLIPVVTEPKKVPGALKWLLGEMEQRYQIFAKCNVRNIVGFNSRKKNKPDELPLPADSQPTLEGITPPPDDIEIPERLPYIVAIIDELADLMMVAPAEIETSIARLAQLARAAGIHLIIATQRPSVNVITGVIKANLPSRIAFQVASQVDSRTILDTKGADTLIGRGDMLFSPPGSSRLVRAQGAFVADEEVLELVEFLKRNGPPQYALSVQQQIDRAASEDDEEEDGADGDLGDDEALYEQALDVLKSSRRASTSMLQRRLRIGYNRAARLMEIMEDKGIVGPENGSSPREILVDLDSL
ncbi:DNA translocase FtsK [Horticoccus luteus]|uniref:DNA translocase FtsK n=1 Tax=Horticoccus luteus TaxID=2862869 RepID=A0A8F9XK80_9BACT|nr:DNA translocase FtsK [Horticoccus luteus]QYM79433.1 DNA translocase FtsK [Horticoccus luteus]